MVEETNVIESRIASTPLKSGSSISMSAATTENAIHGRSDHLNSTSPEKSKKITRSKKSKNIDDSIKKIKVSKEEILSKVTEIRQHLYHLEKSLITEVENLTEMESAVLKSEVIYNDVTHNFQLIEGMIDKCSIRLKDAEEKYKLLTADDLSKCSYENLEDASDILWAGLQAATLALSRRDDLESAKNPSDCTDMQLSSFPTQIELKASTIPQATFYPIPTPVPQKIEYFASDLQKSLIHNMNFLKQGHSCNRETFERYSSNLEFYQVKIEAINENYKLKRETLISLEQKVESCILNVNRLSGKDSYETLSTPQLRGLCKIINKASRRLATEQAIREVYSQQKPMNMDLNTIPPSEETTLCVVCFEKPWDCYINPCQHVLCSSCASRLKYCPRCRSVIQGTTKADALNKEQA